MIALDLSRLLSRAASPTPSGIDRVELAYARWLIAGDRLHCFAARNAIGGIGLLPEAAASAFVTALAAQWRDAGEPAARRRLPASAERLSWAASFGTCALREALREAESSVYLVVSHQNLDRPRAISRLKAATGARFVCMIHDLIPLDFPDFTRPRQTRRHRARIAAVAALAEAAIVNSATTRDALAARLAPRALPVIVAPLGVDLPGAAAERDAPHRYFVCVGTIEPRKNHHLLLDVWRRLVAERGEQALRLMLIGARGFGGKGIARQLQGLDGFVREYAGLSDTAMAAVLRGARGLLLPSLAEGFGLPVAEALALGVPVVCSGLPALLDSGGGVPDHLDPTDGDAWHRAVLDYASDTPRRAAQLARLRSWRPPSWPGHFTLVEQVVAGLG